MAVLSLPAPADPVVRLADRLLADGQIDQAITEYRRYIFFNRNEQGSELGHAASQIALASRHKGRFDEAVAMYQQAIEADASESGKDSLRFELALTEMLRGRYDAADFGLLKVETFSSSPEARARASFLLGISSLYQSNWAAAWEAFDRYLDSGEAEPDVAAALAALKARKPRVKSPSKAKVLSTVLPGLGQVYAGHWLNGLNALALSSAGAVLVVKDVALGQWWDATMDVLNVFGRFYGGNRRGAAKLAIAANARAGRELVEELLRRVEKR